MFAVYVGSLLFGGLLIGASFLGAGHDTDIHTGDAGHGDGHDQNSASAWLALFGIRFWSFAAAFFGLTGLVLRALGSPTVAAMAPVISAAVGVSAGLGASATFRMLARDTIGEVRGAAALVGREGRLLLPVDRTQRGKVRVPMPGSSHLDLVAESDNAAVLAAGSDVLIVEVRGNVAVVEPTPATEPARRS